MTSEDDAIFNVGWALARQSVENGNNAYDLNELIDKYLLPESDSGLSRRIFFGSAYSYYKNQEEICKRLRSHGFAEFFIRRGSSKLGSNAQDKTYFLTITTLGSRTFSQADERRRESNGVVAGLTFDQIRDLLGNDESREQLRYQVEQLGNQIDSAKLTNFDKCNAQAYVSMMIIVCRMPEPDTVLFWKSLERLSWIAGIGALLIGIAALRA